VWAFFYHRQDVVYVVAGRYSRPAEFVTSSELLCLLNMLYIMLSECCDEYNTYTTLQKSSVWCFAFSRTSTFELNSSVAMAQPGALVTSGGEYGFPDTSRTLMDNEH